VTYARLDISTLFVHVCIAHTNYQVNETDGNGDSLIGHLIGNYVQSASQCESHISFVFESLAIRCLYLTQEVQDPSDCDFRYLIWLMLIVSRASFVSALCTRGRLKSAL
jgi:hypothetical protein